MNTNDCAQAQQGTATSEREMQSLPYMQNQLEYQAKLIAVCDFADKLLADIKRDDTLALQQVRLIHTKTVDRIKALREEHGVYQDEKDAFVSGSDLIDYDSLYAGLPA